MKTSLLFLLAFFTLQTTKTEAKVWILNQAPNSFKHFTTLVLAHDSELVEPGDTLYLTGGYNYGDVSIAKKLTLIGPGYFLENLTDKPVNILPAYTGNVTIMQFADEMEIMGVWIGGELNLNGSNAKIHGNHIAYMRIKGNENHVFRNVGPHSNIGFYVYEMTGNGHVLENNFVYNIVQNGNDHTIRNNIFLTSTSFTSTAQTLHIYNNAFLWKNGSNVPPVNSFNGCIVSNNIFSSTQVSLTNSNTANNLLSETQLPANNGNLQNQNLGDQALFLATGANDLYYRQRNTSPARGKGLNGGDIGIWGGQYTYRLSGVPAIPTVQSFSAPGIGTTALPNVSVTFKARN